MSRLTSARLYGILDLGYVAEAAVVATAEAMLEGGIDVIQLRAKAHSPSSIARLVSRVLPACQACGIPLIINDHPELVRETGADGVHIGQDDMPVSEARSLVGEAALIGLSTHSLGQAQAARGVDYIGFGPLFATPTKPDYAQIGLHDIAEAHRLVDLPIFCIGGIKHENLASVLDAGAHRIVVVSGILNSPEIPTTIRKFQATLAAHTSACEAQRSS